MAKPSFSTSRRFWSRPCGKATSSSWTISARTRPPLCAAPSVPPAPGSSTLPKYSPDLNPIEQFFAKFKHWLRKAAQRTTEAVYDAIGPILKTVSPAECANYFANAGYEQT